MLAPAARKTPRELRHEDTERRVLDAATALVAEDGFSALSMSRLADAVGVTPGALYRYIGSKDALLARIMEAALLDVSAFLARGVSRLPASAGPLARVFALGFAYRAFARERPHAFGLLAMSMAEPRVLLREPASAARVVERMEAALSPLSRALSDAAEEGLLHPGDATERTLVVFGLLQGVLQLHKQARHAAVIDLDHLARSGLVTLLLGYGAKATRVEAAVALALSNEHREGARGGTK